MSTVPPALVLVAHGTRNPHGVEMIAELAEQVSRTVPLVRTAFVDVLGPSPAEVLRDLGERPAVVVPAFLASGYHVHVDVPREVAAGSLTADVVITPALGPHPDLATAMAERLAEAGWRPGDAVVFAAAGSSDPRALADVHSAAALLESHLVTRVSIAYIATGTPRVAEVVGSIRNQSHRKVFIATYLLADGLFHQRLHQTGADGVAAPIGVHPAVVSLIEHHCHVGAAVALPS